MNKTAIVYLKRGRTSGNCTFFEKVDLANQMQAGGFQVCDEFVTDLGISPPKDTETIMKVEVSAKVLETYAYMKGGWLPQLGCVDDADARKKGFKYCPNCGIKL